MNRTTPRDRACAPSSPASHSPTAHAPSAAFTRPSGPRAGTRRHAVRARARSTARVAH